MQGCIYLLTWVLAVAFPISLLCLPGVASSTRQQGKDHALLRCHPMLIIRLLYSL